MSAKAQAVAGNPVPGHALVTVREGAPHYRARVVCECGRSWRTPTEDAAYVRAFPHLRRAHERQARRWREIARLLALGA